MGDMMIKIMGATDIIAALIITLLHVPILGAWKWLIVLILAAKGFSSVIA